MGGGRRGGGRGGRMGAVISEEGGFGGAEGRGERMYDILCKGEEEDVKDLEG